MLTAKEIPKWFILIALLVCDQASKFWFQAHDLVVMNWGGVLGIYPSTWWGSVLLLIWLGLLFYWVKRRPQASFWGMGLIIVGGFGNIIDRVLFGSVRDFIYYPGLGFYGNVADILLFVGVLLVMLQSGREKKTTNKA